MQQHREARPVLYHTGQARHKEKRCSHGTLPGTCTITDGRNSEETETGGRAQKERAEAKAKAAKGENPLAPADEREARLATATNGHTLW